ncbi:hypothetical protein [Bifidobacterium sp.]|jgi:hypothetical protein|uniref:hypothetical protein n=1 Tax=Bifidobacterium sp. TaxID=41200 RepID=UPI0025B9D4F8|nr:hypothetical protein [Bifidobacterium sp.]MCI1225207.1 hypothetical protein [Bifidobacterium sp.]
MTDLNNSNAEDERPTPAPDDGAHDAQNPHGAKPDDELWAEFESGHADDLGDIAHSRSAKRFERRAARKEKEALLSVGDLDEGAFTDDMPRPTRGPRDFTASSWLDTDAVLDAQGSDFVPPNPVIGHIDATMIVFWTMLVVGIAGVIASVLLPQFTTLLATVFGVCTLIGGAGLLTRHRGHAKGRGDIFDDGARV